MVITPYFKSQAGKKVAALTPAQVDLALAIIDHVGLQVELNMTVSRETSPEIMAAILGIAGAAAVRVWEAPSYEEVLAVWETVTKNGLHSSTEFCWGAAGSHWAAAFGIKG